MTEIEEESNSLLSLVTPSTGGDNNSSSTTSSSSSENALFGKYEIGRLLGRGAFAKVYFARNVQTGQGVAIKAISKKMILKEGLMSHIKREISIMRLLRHPYIVKLYEVLATKTKIYFILEFAKGGDLYSKIDKCRFSEDLSRRYFQQLISALEYCHSHGVTHRDLKPENLLLDERGDLKVTDFGLGALAPQIQSDEMMLRTFCGTPMYVAPEMILSKGRGKGYNGAKVDVWSCGIILYVLNVGYLPFNDRNIMSLYEKIIKGEFWCPRWVSPDLRRFLNRLLDTNPETRISVDGIIGDPWFKKGYKSIKSHVDSQMSNAGMKTDKDNGMSGGNGADYLNAFDIISFSSGFDLSGLFNDFDTASLDGERFVSAEDPERVLMVVEEIAIREKLAVMRKDWRIVVEGQNGKKHMGMQIFRLTENLAVVDVRSSDGFWSEKFKPELKNMVYRPDSTGT